MFVTIDILQKRGACQDYLDFFVKHYPEGAELLHLIEHSHLPYHALHWGYKWLDPNQEEQAAYWNKVCVEHSEGVDESDHISNCRLIKFSSHITNSSEVYDSENVNQSSQIHYSKFIENSNLISDSEFVEDSAKILKSQNISNCSEIVDSVYVVNSHGIFESGNIVDSKAIWYSKDITNSYFCFNCEKLSNSLFCINKIEDEYLLFNKKIDKNRFDMIVKQFNKYFNADINLISDWEDNSPNKVVDYRKHFENIPESFWSWVRTLPGYDSDIIYSLTFNPLF